VVNYHNDDLIQLIIIQVFLNHCGTHFED